MIDEQKTRLAATLRRLLARHASTGLDSGALCPLSSMQPGQSAIVNEIVSPHYERVERLNILGLVKDARLTLEQKHPTFVLRIGFTQLSIEREVADDILVRVTL